jgi:putative transposase
MRYQALRTDDVALRERMKAIAHKRRRFGYRRLHVLLRREGHTSRDFRPIQPATVAWRKRPNRQATLPRLKRWVDG